MTQIDDHYKRFEIPVHVSRQDVYIIAGHTGEMTDEDMRQIAVRLAERYFQRSYGGDLDIVTEEYLKEKRNDYDYGVGSSLYTNGPPPPGIRFHVVIIGDRRRHRRVRISPGN